MTIEYIVYGLITIEYLAIGLMTIGIGLMPIGYLAIGLMTIEYLVYDTLVSILSLIMTRNTTISDSTTNSEVCFTSCVGC